MGFSRLAGSGPNVGPNWVSGLSAPEPALDPLFRPLPGNDEKTMFGPHLCHCLTTLAGPPTHYKPKTLRIK